MKCLNPECKKDFNPNDHVLIGNGDDESAQIIAECPHCHAEHYAFVEPSEFILAELS